MGLSVKSLALFWAMVWYRTQGQPGPCFLHEHCPEWTEKGCRSSLTTIATPESWVPSFLLLQNCLVSAIPRDFQAFLQFCMLLYISSSSIFLSVNQI